MDMNISLNALALIVLLVVGLVSIFLTFYEYFRPVNQKTFTHKERAFYCFIFAFTFNWALNLTFWGAFGFIALIDWIANNVN